MGHWHTEGLYVLTASASHIIPLREETSRAQAHVLDDATFLVIALGRGTVVKPID